DAGAVDLRAVEPGAAAGLEVFQEVGVPFAHQASVLAADGRVLQGDVRVAASAQDRAVPVKRDQLARLAAADHFQESHVKPSARRAFPPPRRPVPPRPVPPAPAAAVPPRRCRRAAGPRAAPRTRRAAPRPGATRPAAPRPPLPPAARTGPAGRIARRRPAA